MVDPTAKAPAVLTTVDLTKSRMCALYAILRIQDLNSNLLDTESLGSEEYGSQIKDSGRFLEDGID